MEDTKTQDLDGPFPNQVRSGQGSPLGNRSLQLFGKARSNNGDFPGSRRTGFWNSEIRLAAIDPVSIGKAGALTLP
jgi:hypothetical protein